MLLLWLVPLGLTLGGGIALYTWSRWTRYQEIVAAIPTRPDLRARPQSFIDRIATCEQRIRDGTNPINALGELAALYEANGFIPDATRSYQVLQRVDAKNPRWAHRLAGLLAGYGQADAAQPLLRRVLALAPDYLPARLRLADVLLKANQPDEAQRFYASVISRDQKNAYAVLGLLRCAPLTKNPTDLATLQALVAHAEPDFATTWNLLAALEARGGKRFAAHDARARAASGEKYRDGPDPWNDDLAEDCYDTYRLRVAAAAQADGGDPAGARALLLRALAIAPDDPTTHRQLGALLLQEREFTAARGELERCTSLEPDEPEGWALLAHDLEAVGNNDRALAALTIGLSHCPDAAGLYYERGLVLKTSGRLDEAANDFRTALRLRPEEANLHIELAQIDFHFGRDTAGAQELRQALAVEPEQPVALTSLTWYEIGAGHRVAAQEALRQVRQQPRVPRADLAALEARFQQSFGAVP